MSKNNLTVPVFMFLSQDALRKLDSVTRSSVTFSTIPLSIKCRAQSGQIDIIDLSSLRVLFDGSPTPSFQCPGKGMIIKPRLPWRSAKHYQSYQLRLPSINPPASSPLRNRPFHSSPHWRDDGLPDHYAALELHPDASAADIKKHFYRLSKSHHPDLHPNDPSASQRFVELSTAYDVLSSPEKKAHYDRDYFRATGRTSPPHRSGSYSSSSSSSSPAGGRPGHGLSRRRTQFRGPPPSFYRSGGWGAHGAKRSAAASEPSHSHEAHAREQQAATGPGMGPGGFARGNEDDVPHFDAMGHRRTHVGIEARHRERRAAAAAATMRRRMEDMEVERGGSSVLFNFLMVTGVVGLVVIGSVVFVGVGGANSGGRGGGGMAATGSTTERQRKASLTGQ